MRSYRPRPGSSRRDLIGLGISLPTNRRRPSGEWRINSEAIAAGQVFISYSSADWFRIRHCKESLHLVDL